MNSTRIHLPQFGKYMNIIVNVNMTTQYLLPVLSPSSQTPRRVTVLAGVCCASLYLPLCLCVFASRKTVIYNYSIGEIHEELEIDWMLMLLMMRRNCG